MRAELTATAAVAAQKPRRKSTSRTLVRCMSYLQPYWRYVVGAYSILLINNLITLAMPRIIQFIVDSGIRAASVPAIVQGTLGLLGLTLVRGILTFLQGRWTEVASQNVAYDLRNAIHDKLQSLSFSYHDRAESGQLLTRAISDVDRIRFLTGRAFMRTVEVVTLVAGIAFSMIQLNAGLALLTLTLVPFLTYGAIDYGLKFRPLSRAIQQQLSVLTTRLEQNLRGSRVVSAFAQERIEIEHFDTENLTLFRANMRAARMNAIYMPLLQVLASAGTIFILLYGGRLVINGQLTLGELVAFTTYVGQLLGPVRRLGMVIGAIAQAAASGDRIFEILDANSDVHDLPGALPIGQVNGHVRFEHVSFSYFGRHQVLKDIDFEAQPGQVVALLGTTGSGKSSVINLIPRFYDPTEGRILVDGRDIRHVTIASLREQIGIVLQDTTLFATTVRKNITFGRPNATEEEMIAAAKAAAAHDFILQLPQGYDTRVGEKGHTLSGGQKQRVAIARAILNNPRILILDDATSSVDTETEAAIQAALAELMVGRTSFVIAQRLSTIRRADLVLVLDKGHIVARGRRTAEHTAHDELMRSSGLYAEIYHRQLRPQEVTA
jgi:ABC-type multidrug transport system fused ATPase/permease subunit